MLYGLPFKLSPSASLFLNQQLGVLLVFPQAGILFSLAIPHFRSLPKC